MTQCVEGRQDTCLSHFPDLLIFIKMRQCSSILTWLPVSRFNGFLRMRSVLYSAVITLFNARFFFYFTLVITSSSRLLRHCDMTSVVLHNFLDFRPTRYPRNHPVYLLSRIWNQFEMDHWSFLERNYI